MKICVRIHDFGKSTANDLANKASAMGFDGIQLAINKSIVDQTALPGTLNDDLALEINTEFKNKGLEIAMIGSYFNPVHSNKESVEENILKFKEHLKYANAFQTKYIGTETGSFNDDKWTYNPLNRTEEAFQKVKNIFKELAEYAEEVNSNIAIEGANGHCMYAPKVLKRMLDEIDNGHMFITVDIYNWLNIDNYQNHTQIFDECIELFKDKIVIFHLKDFKIVDNKLKQVGLGQGLMNLEYMIPRMQKFCPNAYLTFEGVLPPDMPSSLELVRKLLK